MPAVRDAVGEAASHYRGRRVARGTDVLKGWRGGRRGGDRAPHYGPRRRRRGRVACTLGTSAARVRTSMALCRTTSVPGSPRTCLPRGLSAPSEEERRWKLQKPPIRSSRATSPAPQALPSRVLLRVRLLDRGAQTARASARRSPSQRIYCIGEYAVGFRMWAGERRSSGPLLSVSANSASDPLSVRRGPIPSAVGRCRRRACS